MEEQAEWYPVGLRERYEIIKYGAKKLLGRLVRKTVIKGDARSVGGVKTEQPVEPVANVSSELQIAGQETAAPHQEITDSFRPNPYNNAYEEHLAAQAQSHTITIVL